MKFKQLLPTKKFLITGELAPPKGTDLEDFDKNVGLIKDYVDAINVTDNQRAIMRASSLACAAHLVQAGIPAIWQITGRDRNSLALESDILGTSILGIENILVVGGDYPAKKSKHFPKPVYELDSVQIIQLIKKLETGFDLNDQPLKGKPSFTIGAVANPEAEPLEIHLLKLWKKVSAGAQFIQTQPIFEISQFEKFFEAFLNYQETFEKNSDCQKPLVVPKFLVGVFPLTSLKTARFLHDNLAGVKIPEKIFTELEKSPDQVQTGLEAAVELIEKLKAKSDGVHLMAMGAGEIMQKILRSQNF